MTQEEIDALIKGGDLTGDSDSSNIGSSGINIDTPDFPDLPQMDMQSEPTSVNDPKLALLYDLQLPVSIELGRTSMLIRDILRLGRGSVVEFDKLVSEPVDVLVNGKKVAEGEVVVVDKHFGIRITTLVDPTDRLRNLKR
ncbi:MAG: flagellar motor switch protein FliN [Ignavibacteriae bacterium]|nr:flagellar motor switch protein FliN [Ignavibacteriota bacterium]